MSSVQQHFFFNDCLASRRKLTAADVIQAQAETAVLLCAKEDITEQLDDFDKAHAAILVIWPTASPEVAKAQR